MQHLIKADINVQWSQFGKDFQILSPLKMPGCTILCKNLIVPNRLPNIRLILSRKWKETPQGVSADFHNCIISLWSNNNDAKCCYHFSLYHTAKLTSEMANESLHPFYGFVNYFFFFYSKVLSLVLEIIMKKIFLEMSANDKNSTCLWGSADVLSTAAYETATRQNSLEFRMFW